MRVLHCYSQKQGQKDRQMGYITIIQLHMYVTRNALKKIIPILYKTLKKTSVQTVKFNTQEKHMQIIYKPNHVSTLFKAHKITGYNIIKFIVEDMCI